MNTHRKLTKTLRCVICGSLLMAVMVLLFFSVPVKAQTNRAIRVGYINYGGFIDQDENGDYYGYCVDYLEEVSKYTGWKYEFVYDSFSNLLSMLDTGEIDMLCQTQKTAEREKRFLFSDYQVGVEIAALYVSEVNSGLYFYDDAESLGGMVVAMMEGSSQNEFFAAYAKAKGFTYQPVYYETVTECMDAVVQGEADGLIMGSLAGQDKEGLRVAGRFSADPYYVMTGKQNQEVLDQMNEAQKELSLQEPYLEAELYTKYYEDTTAFAGILYTREEGEYIAENPSITLGVKQDSLPLSDYSGEEGAYGILVDTMDSIGENCGLEFQYAGRSDAETSEHFLENHENYGTIGVFKNAARQEGLILSDVLYTTSTALVGKSGDTYSLDTKNTVYTIAIPKSYTRLRQYIHSKYPKYELKTYNSYADCLKAVQSEKADYTALTLDVVTCDLDNPHYEGLSILNVAFMSEEYRLAMNDTQENRLLISIINKSLRALSKVVIEQIRVNHTTADRYQMNYRDVLHKYRFQLMGFLFLIFLILALLVAYIILRNNSMKKIQQSAKKAEKANLAKSDFLSRMSHDIRTPLNAVLGYARLAKLDLADGKDCLGDINQIEESGSFLLGLVNDVLDMSKIESGAIELFYEPVSVQSFEAQIRTLFKEKCMEKQIAFHIDTQKAFPYARLDKLRFKQVVFNLLSNAIKFTGQGGNVWLTISGRQMEKRHVMICVFVKDDGIGMSKEFQKHIFEPFVQETTSASGMEGSGLGLAIVNQLVTLMDGTISFQSEKGQGTEFMIEIPTTICTKEDIEKAYQQVAEHLSLAGKKVLLCEDHPINAALAKRILEQAGMEVVHAVDGKAGVERFEESNVLEYAAILMDIRMPVMDGIQAAKAIRSLDRPDATLIPIIALTANAYMEDQEKTKQAGMNAHLAKPFQPEVLFKTLEYQIQKAERTFASKQ